MAEELYSEDRNVHLRTVTTTRATIGAHSRRTRPLPRVRQSDRMDERDRHGHVSVSSFSYTSLVCEGLGEGRVLLDSRAVARRSCSATPKRGDRSLAARHLIVVQDEVGSSPIGHPKLFER